MAEVKLSTFIGSILFIGLLLAPLTFADYIDDRDRAHSFEGDLEFLRGQETVEDLGLGKSTRFEGGFSEVVDGGNAISCGNGVGLFTRRNFWVPGNSVSPISQETFGNGYGHSVVNTQGLPCLQDVHKPYGPGPTTLFSGFWIYFNITTEELAEARTIDFILHLEDNLTFDTMALNFIHEDETGATVDYFELVHGYQKISYTSGEVLSLPITTTHRIIANQIMPKAGELPAGHSLRLKFTLYFHYTDTNAPEEGDLIIYDMEIQQDRVGLFDGVNALVSFNVGYVLIGGLLLVVATPWVSFSDLVGSKRRR